MNAEQILSEMLVDLIRSERRASQATVVVRPTDEALAACVIDKFKQRVQNECEQLDGKRAGLVWRRKDGQVSEGFFILMPHDKLANHTLVSYMEACKQAGCDECQIDGMSRVMQRFADWQAAYPELMKQPDADPGECK